MKEQLNYYTTSEDSTYIAEELKLSVCHQALLPVDLMVVDSASEDGLRFSLHYVLKSLISQQTYIITSQTDELQPVASLQSLFPAMNWAEREAWDFFGVDFINHPDLRRILTDYGFSGYPLRKDFPLSGYSEVHFDDAMKSVEHRPVELTQAFRVFRRMKIWEDA